MDAKEKRLQKHKEVGMMRKLAKWFMALAVTTIALSVSAATVTVLEETFEGVFPGNWSVGDANSSGTTAYWKDVNASFGGVSTPDGSAWKGYCAGVGYSGTTSAPQYQNSMSAYMSRSIDLTGAASGLSFGLTSLG